MKKPYFSSYIIILFIICFTCFFYFKQLEFKPLEANTNYNWAIQNNVDYPNNDISSFSNLGVITCKNKCFNTNGCVGIVTDYSPGYGPGNCWLKSSLNSNNKTTNKPRWTYIKP